MLWDFCQILMQKQWLGDGWEGETAAFERQWRKNRERMETQSRSWELVVNKDEWGHGSTNAANKFIMQLEAETAN